jgi:carboxypeptidase C (cathepsin A)
MIGRAYLRDVLARLRDTKAMADRSLGQIPEHAWFRRLDPESNSLATIMQHMSGNMVSRWTDFLTSDGEKANRDRDAEFEDPPKRDPALLREKWEEGWVCVFRAIEALDPEDLERTVTIRFQEHTVLEASQRQLAHYSYHVGQIVFLAKHYAGDRWNTLSVARGQSQSFNDFMNRKYGVAPDRTT